MIQKSILLLMLIVSGPFGAAAQGDQPMMPLKVSESGRFPRTSDGKPFFWLALTGTWRFQLDPNDVGEEEQWFDRELREAIQLPSTTDLAGKGYALDRATMSYQVPHLKSGIKHSQGVERMDEVGYLVRDRLFIGKAWYQRTIEIPDAWASKRLQLRLERVNWQSTVWLDGTRIGSCDSLVADHRFDLGWAKPGNHVLTIRVDNDLIHEIGVIGHAYGPETQSRWNGIVGRIELDAVAPVHVKAVQVFPAANRRSVRVRITTGNTTDDPASGQLRVVVEPATTLAQGSGVPLGVLERSVAIPVGEGTHEQTLEITRPVEAWDEFNTTRYRVRVELTSDVGSHARQALFGFRHIERVGRHIKVNGRRIFLRGTLDCCVYPKTGHPPVTIEAWLRVLGTIKEHGFNHVRFHTWCPPDAAFEAADRLGIYLAPETPFWVDDWTANTNPNPKPLGKDRRITKYVRDEIRRISDAYGNHPSFAFFCVGNEFGKEGTDWNLANELLIEVKRRDPRRLYNASTARRRVAADDFWVTHRTEKVDTRGIGPAHTNWDFSAAAASTDLPLLAHETGQRPVFPDYDDLLPKFTGPLKPYNLQRLRRRAVDNGIVDQIKDFERVSADFQLIQYKAEHEGMLRTRDYAGYQLLMLNDFTGQGEAHVGLLDPFWESKGVVNADDVRQWNAPTVLLARFDRYVWTNDQTFEAQLEVAHFGEDALAGAKAEWSLTARDGKVLAHGQTKSTDVPRGGLTVLGKVTAPLATLKHATALSLKVTLGDVSNRWPIWVYPPTDDESDLAPEDILITRTFDDAAKKKLAGGGRILLLAQGTKHARADRSRNGFESVYWSGGWWGNKFSQLGILCEPKHAALVDFPTEEHSDWQWHALTSTATTFDLTGLLPVGYRPIVQPVPDFHHSRLLGHLFEVRAGKGRLLICGYDLTRDLATRHAARQFRRSVIQYMRSDAFDPQTTLSLEQLAELVPPRETQGEIQPPPN